MTWSTAAAVGNLPNHIHKIHMGEHLAKKNYNYGVLLYNETLFPQDLRNCTKCHDGSATSTAQTTQGDNWKNVPNRLACGACHDGINFATGMGVTIADAPKGLDQHHQLQRLCPRRPGAGRRFAVRDLPHAGPASTSSTPPVTPPNADQRAARAARRQQQHQCGLDRVEHEPRLPAGAIKVTYDIQSVSRNASKQPVMVFRIAAERRCGSDSTPSTARDQPGRPATRRCWDNFMGSPSAQFVFAVPQDGIAAPADFNAAASGYLRSIWNGIATGTRRRHADRARRQRLLHRHADRRDDSRQRGDAHRRHGLSRTA